MIQLAQSFHVFQLLLPRRLVKFVRFVVQLLVLFDVPVQQLVLAQEVYYKVAGGLVAVTRRTCLRLVEKTGATPGGRLPVIYE